MREIVKWFRRYVFGLGAFTCFGFTLAFTFVDRVPAATLMAALFVVLVLFHYLPQMEHFKALGVEAKWRARLDEADEILRKLRRSALVSAKLTYHTLAWSSRLGGETQESKQTIADETDEVLQALEVPADEVAGIKQDYLYLAKVDLFYVFNRLVMYNVRSFEKQLGQELSEADTEKNRTKIQERLARLREQSVRREAFNELRSASFKNYTYGSIPKDLPTNRKSILTQFASDISEIADSCKRQGKVTDKAVEIIDKHTSDRGHRLYKEMFGEQPPS